MSFTRPKLRVRDLLAPKKIEAALALMLATLSVVFLAATPQTAQAATAGTLNFQARLQTNTGAIVPDGTYNVEFKLYNVASGGSTQWTEDYLNNAAQGVTVKNGYLTVNLGSITLFPGTINWDQDQWLTMTVRGTGSCAFAACTPADAEMGPNRLKLTATPYAFRAGQLATGNGTLQSTLSIIQPTVGNQIFQIQDQAAAGTYNLCIQNSVACGFAASSGATSYIQNATGGPQTANFNILSAGTGSIGAQIQAVASATVPVLVVKGGATPGAGSDLIQFQSNAATLGRVDNAGNLFLASGTDTQTATTLTLGNSNATAISLGKTASNIATTINGTALVKPTAGNNSTTAFQVQNAGGTPVTTVDTTNSKLILQGTVSDGVLGSEQVTSQAFNNATFWTCTNWTNTATTATHITGNTSTCSATASNFTVTAGTYYQVSFTLANNTTDTETVMPSIGGANGPALGQTGTNNQTVVIKATGTGALTFTPTTNFNGRISAVSVMPVTVANSVLQVNNSGATNMLELRATSSNNTLVGFQAGQLTQSGASANTAFGRLTLTSNISGANNTAVGNNALQNNTTGSANASLGVNALQNNTTGGFNNAFGNGSLGANLSGSNNTGFGNNALGANTTGGSNSAVGNNALNLNISGSGNTADGNNALNSNTTGDNNTGIGNNSLANNTTGTRNTALGYFAGKLDTDGFTTSATIVGATAIGQRAQVQASNTLILGGAGSSAVNVGIGTTIPTNIFSVSPTEYSTGTAGTGGVSSTSVTGVGTSWTGAVSVGDEIIWQDGAKSTISVVGGNTSLTIASAVTEANTQAYRIHYVGLQVTSAGKVGVGTSAPVYALDVNGDINTSTQYRIGGSVALTNASLAFAAASAATIQSAAGQSLTVDSGTTGTLNLGTGANSKTINIGATLALANTTTANIATSTGATQLVNIGGTGAANGSSANSVVKIQGGATGLSIAGAGVTIQTYTNTSTALQVQNAAAYQIVGVDTANAIGTTNLVANPNLEINTTGWSGWGSGGAVSSQTTNIDYAPTAGQVTISSTANGGAKYTLGSLANGTYSLSFNIKTSTTGSTPVLGYNGGGADTDHLCTPTYNYNLYNGGFTRVNCSFTVATGGGASPYIFVGTNGVAQTDYFDAVQLESGASVTPFQQANIALRGVIDVPLSLRTTYNSDRALAVVNSVGKDVFVADTVGFRVRAGYDTAANSNGDVLGNDCGAGFNTCNGVRLGSIASGEGVGSNRVSAPSGGNVFGLDLYTNNLARLRISNTGNVVVGVLDPGTSSSTFNVQGTAIFGGVSSTTAFQIQDSSNASLFTANTTSNLVKLGNSTGTDTATTLLQLDSATADVSTSLATKNGSLYYNSTSTDLKAIENGQVGTLGSWKFLGNTTLGVSAANTATLTITAKKHLLIRYHIAGYSGGGSIARWQFGAGAIDTGTNYAFRAFDDYNTVTSTNTTAAVGIQVANTVVTTERFGEVEIWNINGQAKRVTINGTTQSAQTSAAVNTINQVTGIWTNTGQITSIRLNGNAVNLLANTEFSVWGADDN